MSETLHPGLYIEEISSGVHPVEGVSTTTTAIVGLANQGPVLTPTLVTSWTDYVAQFGSFTTGMYMARAARGFFENGGKRLYVMRVAGSGNATAKYIALDRASSALATLWISAYSPGTWGNSLTVDVTDNPKATTALYSTAAKNATSIHVDSDAGISVGSVIHIVSATKEYHKVTAITKIGTGDYLLSLNSAIATDPGPIAIDAVVTTQEFDVVVKLSGEVVERYTQLCMDTELDNYVVKQITALSTYIVVADQLTASGVGLKCPAALSAQTLSSTAGSNGSAVVVGDWTTTGDYGVFASLDTVTDMNILVAPDANLLYATSASVAAIQDTMIDYCAHRQDCFAITDIPLKSTGAVMSSAEALTYKNTTLNNGTSFGAAYWPYVKVYDTLTATYIYIPGSGHIAGAYAATDMTRGVHKAPAGMGTILSGVFGLNVAITDAIQDTLNPQNINCLRTFPGSGIVVWGARTLSSDSEWKYINVRRAMIYIEQSLLYGMKWAIFEPNTENLWLRLRLNISAFLRTCWSGGMLVGNTPAQAYYVKCDAQNNPQSSVDQGKVFVEVGVAISKPAEFVIIRIGQWDGGRLLQEVLSV